MEIPSIHGPNGLSREDRNRLITVTRRVRQEDYEMGDFGNENMGNVHYMAANDVEMMPIDEMEEAQMISDMVASSRVENDYSMSDEMDLDKHILHTTTVTLQGNVSYLIIDTNFILSQLHILDQLKDIGQQYGLMIVIPTQVVRELDGLKSSHRMSNELYGGPQDISRLARAANDWIFTCLSQRCPTVKGQAAKEKLDKFATKDDAILDCCLYYKEEYKHTLQILFSNDKNLCLKALINEILTVSYLKDMSSRLIAEKIYEENVMRFGHIEPTTVANVEMEVPINDTSGNPEQICHSVYSEILAVVAHVVKQHMLSEYGEDIDLIRDYDKNSCVDLEGAVKIIIRFWRPVFSTCLRGYEPFKEIGSRSVPIMVDLPAPGLELLNFVDFWGRLLVRLYEKNTKLDGLDVLRQHAKKWNDLARSTV
ncbi:hypothetical protein HF325_000975 [Metschnikowia pulcherrima]|uniref:Transcriptional protein SWT1 n=1 Tax=Metschnikowia pulcherrima TaxID=27326 RepID=A0A8H7LF59_9ASCO|nr:hypothetical protein HF325_000975 [Metschnikowia pulcherrima]